MSKTALITGASNGIGYELAKIHAENKGNLILVARSLDKLNTLKGELEAKHNISVLTIAKDLSVPGAAREVYDEVKKESLGVDLLINNAGFGDYCFFAESDWNKQEQMVNLNIIALIHLTWLFLREMICRHSGKILNVASTASFLPGPAMSVYFATKAFVLSFSEAVNEEVRDKGITITALCPGSTRSGFQAAATRPDKTPGARSNMASSREVAEYGYAAMLKGKAVAIHGLKNVLMINTMRFIPRSVVLKLVKMSQLKKL
jgi:uncharacterized protein